MIVPADAAEMTKGRPYVGLDATRVAAVVVAKFPLLAWLRKTTRSISARLLGRHLPPASLLATDSALV